MHLFLHMPVAFATMGVSRPDQGASDVPVRPMVSVARGSIVSSDAADRAHGYDVMTLTSVIDNRAHMVTDVELSSPHAVRMGRYEALCGHLIAPAPMVVPDGARCQRCAELGGTGRPVAQASRRPRGFGRRPLA